MSGGGAHCGGGRKVGGRGWGTSVWDNTWLGGIIPYLGIPGIHIFWTDDLSHLN